MGGKGSKSQPIGTSEEQIIFVSPAIESLIIEVPSFVTIKVRAQDKERTMDFFFLNKEEYRKFTEGQNSMLTRRYAPDNKLSLSEWKTKEDALLSASVDAGQYWIVWRSSSKVRDKRVRMLLIVATKAQDRAEKFLKPIKRIAKSLAEDQVIEIVERITTPDYFNVTIDRDTVLQLRITCVDPNRTMDVQFLDEAEFAQCTLQMNNITSRYTVKNGLSDTKWKTKSDYLRQMPLKGGTYYVLVRSSSVLRDKCASCNITVRYADDGKLLTSIAAGRHRTSSFVLLDQKEIDEAAGIGPTKSGTPRENRKEEQA